MKITFFIYYFDIATGIVDQSVMSGSVEAISEKDALAKWTNYVNSIAGAFKTFKYVVHDPLLKQYNN